MEIQQAIKNNADDLQTFTREMKLWEKEMKQKEKLLLEFPQPDQDQNLPPIRNKVSKMEDEGSVEQDFSTQQKREQSLFEKERGNEYVKQGRWAEAIYHYSEAINSYSWDATFYTNRALCFLKLNKWREAETDCTTALQIDATYDKAYFRRALARKELNQLRPAKADLLEALQLNPDNKSAHNEIVKLEKLIPELRSSEVKVDLPKDKKQLAYMKKEKGNAFVKSKDWKSAIECYTEACSLYPEDASFYLNRSLCFLKSNEPQKAIIDCCRVLEFDPNNVKAHYRRAQAHRKLNNFSKAHDDLLAAFKLDPSNEDVEKLLNTIEDRLGVLPKEAKKEEELKKKDEIPGSSEHSKRITGERFLKLGGQYIKPEKKAAHMLSKKPLRKINIVDTDEKSKSILQSALNDLNSVDQITHIDDNLIDTGLNGAGECKANTSSPNNAKPDVNDFHIPKTAIQFTSSWNKLNSDPGRQFAFLKKIGGSNFPCIFKDALESYIFSDILYVLTMYSTELNEPVYEFLSGLSKVKRFSALLLFATAEDNENIERLLQHCEKSEIISKDQMDELRSRYHCL